MNTTLKTLLLFLSLGGVIFIFYIFQASHQNPKYRTEKISEIDNKIEKTIKTTYDEANLESHIHFEIFRKAMIGFYHIEDLKFRDRIVIIDYSKPSTEERFYVVDLENKKLLYECWVAHGINSGEDYATLFSNVQNSKTSSLGLFLTAETYQGKNGFSLRLDGVEKGINHNARKRDIVIHGADYVSGEFIHKEGRLGKSWGCPALPNTLSDEIIKAISGGRCLFIFANDELYFSDSHYTIKNNS